MSKNHSLSHSLLETWDKYENQVRLCRNKISTRNIHELRILTQRLEAALTLIQYLRSDNKSKNAIIIIKKVRKSLGSLRDIQVESKALRNLSENKLKDVNQKKFMKFFSMERIAAKKKAVKCLNEISLKKERLRIEKCAKQISHIEARMNERQINTKLKKKFKSSLINLNHEMSHIHTKRVQDIHRFRIHAKKLRYQGELLNFIIEPPQLSLENLKTAQAIAGKIQNDSLLLGTLDQFLSKKKQMADPKILSFRNRINAHQRRLINKDFKELSRIKWEN